jgi:hypothetical protein
MILARGAMRSRTRDINGQARNAKCRRIELSTQDPPRGEVIETESRFHDPFLQERPAIINGDHSGGPI